MEETGYSFPIAEVDGDGDPGRVRKDFSRALERDRRSGGVYAITSRDTLLACREIQERGLADRVRLVGSDVFRELVPFLSRASSGRRYGRTSRPRRNGPSSRSTGT